MGSVLRPLGPFFVLRRSPFRFDFFVGLQRKIQRDVGSTTWGAVNLHDAVMFGNDAADHGQAQSGALTGGLGGEEGVKGPSQNFWRHANTIVDYADFCIVDGAQGGVVFDM